MKAFLHLLQKEWNENKFVFLRFFIGMILFVSCFMIYNYPNHYGKKLLENHFFVVYMFALVTVGVFSSYQAFLFTEKRSKTTTEIQLPATTFQKWLSKFVIYHLLCLIACILLFVCFQKVAFSMIETSKFSEIIPLSRLPEVPIMVIVTLAVYALMQAFVFTGMLHFKKSSFIKTIVFMAFVISIFIYYTYWLAEAFFDDRMNSLFLDNKVNSHWHDSYNIYNQAPEVFQQIKWFSILFIIPSLLFVASYFKFKERELR